MNILIVCGGTGGHLFPGIALGEELLKRHHQVLLVVSEKEIDQKALQGSHGFLVQTLPAVGWRGWRPDRGLQFILRMSKALNRTKQIFQDFNPEVVLGMGGFSSVAPLIVAWRKKIPACIHESNAIAGKANRLAGKLVAKIAVGFEAAISQFSVSKTVWTGTPVRSTLRSKKERLPILEKLGLSPTRPTVLIMGGSQGARGLNRIVVDVASQMTSEIQWIHLAGTEDEANIRERYARDGKVAKVYAFCHEMEDLYSVADLVIARSGAASLAEIAHHALPSILIPYPFAAEKHQSVNAQIFAKNGAALVWEESECDPKILAMEIQNILSDQRRHLEMANATKELRYEDAHQRLADVVEELKKN